MLFHIKNKKNLYEKVYFNVGCLIHSLCWTKMSVMLYKVNFVKFFFVYNYIRLYLYLLNTNVINL